MVSGDGEKTHTASPNPSVVPPWLKLPGRKCSGGTRLGPTRAWTKMTEVPQKCSEVKVCMGGVGKVRVGGGYA